ncbi:LacI family DNA-binding transcriptional regulator [Actinoplanes sp. HUAS TT8]|uniref:LacI family DNA-binding transcriptional regulator n=1 Tax=Actinoplanes sp. HUAS TT8 TaxID=3447453 RepID=UPI003F52891D
MGEVHAGLADVARRAGVSPATASRVLSGTGPASTASRAAVLTAAEELGYRPHPVARQLARRSGTRVVFVVRDERTDILRDPFVTRATAAMAAVLNPYQIGMSLSRVGLECAAELDHLAADRGVAAVVLAGHDRELLAHLPPRLRGRTAVIGLGGTDISAGSADVSHRNGAGTDVSCGNGVGGADVDSASGIGGLITHLYALGRRRIALVAGPSWLAASAPPVRVYAELTRAAGLPVRIVRGDFTSVRGRAAARVILRRWPDTDAVATVSDATAMGVVQALAATGIKVPDDVAVTGFDDVPLAGALYPALSTATHPVEEIAVAAVKSALGESPQVRLFPSIPMIRETCGGGGACGGSASTA